jgi:hypothetical protein
MELLSNSVSRAYHHKHCYSSVLNASIRGVTGGGSRLLRGCINLAVRRVANGTVVSFFAYSTAMV